MMEIEYDSFFSKLVFIFFCQVWCCWDSRLLQFNNVDLPKPIPNEDKNLTILTKAIKDIDPAKFEDHLLQQAIQLNNSLGILTTLQMVWADKEGIKNETSVYLGQLCQIEVDSFKSGDIC